MSILCDGWSHGAGPAVSPITLTLGRSMPEEDRIGGTRIENFARTAEFWRRSCGIYLSYKVAQTKAWRLKRKGWDAERLRDHHWHPHHTWAGQELYQLAVDLRGFYLKVY